MAKPKIPPFGGLTAADKQWLDAQFTEIDEALERMMHNLKKLGKYVTPELESIINEVSKRAKSIDEKVIDLPPGK